MMINTILFDSLTINWIHFLSSIWMTTILWFVQIVHYPLFLAVPKQALTQYSEKHQLKISILVLPGMLIEVASLIWLGKDFVSFLIWKALILCTLIVWGSTFFIQVPLHKQLTISPNYDDIHKLIKSNWLRTIFWTVKCILAFFLLREVL